MYFNVVKSGWSAKTALLVPLYVKTTLTVLIIFPKASTQLDLCVKTV